MDNIEKYNQDKVRYQSALDSLCLDLKGFFLRDYPGIDIHTIYGRVKEWPSLLKKMEIQSRSKIDSLEDVVGLRVICHCKSDYDIAIRVLNDYLRKKYKKVSTKDKNEEEGYKAYHFVFKDDNQVPCEVQVKTVLQEAWTAQSHKYLYKKNKKEGDADILAKTVSGILDNCEHLWELVKKEFIKDSAEAQEIEKIVEATKADIQAVEREVSEDFVKQITDLFKDGSASSIVDLKDIVDKEVTKIKKLWLEVSKNFGDDSFSIMESSVKNLTILGLCSIKYDNNELLKYILDQFSVISDISKYQSGKISFLSIPAATLHNIFYYFLVYSLKSMNASCMKLLIEYKMEREYNGSYYLRNIWSSGSVFAPAILNGATLMFDRLRNVYNDEDVKIKEFLGLDNEQFLDLACQVNLLFCLKALQLEEKNPNDDHWAYPNFGRFYAERVISLVNRSKNRQDYKDFVKKVLEEDINSVVEKAPGRLKTLSERLGGEFWWTSITDWGLK